MIRAFWRTFCFCLFTGLFTGLPPLPSLTASAQVGSKASPRVIERKPAKPPQLPEIGVGDFRPLVLPTFRYDLLPPPIIVMGEPAATLHNAITKRLGVRYRYRGVDDRGYDCSGFVWSVFKETGADYERGYLRPEALRPVNSAPSCFSTEANTSGSSATPIRFITPHARRA
jgi:hypothetical protein